MKFERILLIIIAAIVSFQFIHTIRNDINFDDEINNTPKITIGDIRVTYDNVQKLVIALSQEQQLIYHLKSNAEQYTNTTRDNFLLLRGNIDILLNLTASDLQANIDIYHDGHEYSLIGNALFLIENYQQGRHSIDQIVSPETTANSVLGRLHHHYTLTIGLVDLLHYITHQLPSAQNRASYLLKLDFLYQAIAVTRYLAPIYTIPSNTIHFSRYDLALLNEKISHAKHYIQNMYQHGVLIGFDESKNEILNELSITIREYQDEFTYALKPLLPSSDENNGNLNENERKATLILAQNSADKFFKHVVTSLPEHIAKLGL